MSAPSGQIPQQRSPGSTSRSTTSPTLWKLEPATAAKHQLYRSYLDAWFAIMLQSGWPRLTYLDAFAGPGEYLDGEDGSPVFALERLLNHTARERMSLSRDRVTMIFIEARRDRYEHLLARLIERFGPLEDLPVTVIVEHGHAEHDAMRLLSQHGAWGRPMLAIFDSWGNVSVPWSDLRRIALNPSSEMVVTFGPNWFSRRESQNPDQLDTVFGGREFWLPSNQRTTPADRWAVWLNTYREAVGRAGFNFPLSFQVLPQTGVPLDLVFGTTHPAGVAAFKEAMWSVDYAKGMSFKDPRTTVGKAEANSRTQGLLFADPDRPDEDLIDAIIYILAQKPATLDDVRLFLQNETPRWLAKQARPTISYLIEDGAVVRVDTGGRMNGSTLLRLAR